MICTVSREIAGNLGAYRRATLVGGGCVVRIKQKNKKYLICVTNLEKCLFNIYYYILPKKNIELFLKGVNNISNCFCLFVFIFLYLVSVVSWKIDYSSPPTSQKSATWSSDE